MFVGKHRLRCFKPKKQVTYFFFDMLQKKKKFSKVYNQENEFLHTSC